MDKLKKSAGISLTILLQIIVMCCMIINRCYITAIIRCGSGIDSFIASHIHPAIFLEVIIVNFTVIIFPFQKAIHIGLAVVLEIISVSFTINHNTFQT